MHVCAHTLCTRDLSNSWRGNIRTTHAVRLTHYALTTSQVPDGATQGQHMQAYTREHLVRVFFLISKRTTAQAFVRVYKML